MRLPNDLKDLSGPAASGLRQVGAPGAEKVLETGTAQSLWETANRTAHEQLLAVVENKKEAVSTANGEVKLNLGSLLTNLAGQIGLAKDLAEQLPAGSGPDHDPQVGTAKDRPGHRRRDQGAGADALDPHLPRLRAGDLPDPGRALDDGSLQRRRADRRRAARAGLSHVAGGVVVDQLVKQDNVKPAAEAAWSIGTSLMVSIATTIIIVGVFFSAAGWLSSPTGSARGARRVIAPALNRYLPYCTAGSPSSSGST